MVQAIDVELTRRWKIFPVEGLRRTSCMRRATPAIRTPNGPLPHCGTEDCSSAATTNRLNHGRNLLLIPDLLIHP